MATYLLKTEPGEYSYADLERDGVAPWDGVTNAAAQKAMRGVRTGDEVLIYHTGDEKRIAGLARVARGAYPDPAVPGLTAAGEPKGVLVDVEPVRAATTPATLADVKADARFAEFELVRQPRLSVMAVPPALAKALKSMAGL